MFHGVSRSRFLSLEYRGVPWERKTAVLGAADLVDLRREAIVEIHGDHGRRSIMLVLGGE